MEGVTVVDHPLVQHKLTLIRGKNISTKSFRELFRYVHGCRRKFLKTRAPERWTLVCQSCRAGSGRIQC
jgi:hypothetical protein